MRIDYVQAVRSKGRTYYYFRRGSQRVSLPGKPGSAEFMDAYREALDSQRVEVRHRAKPGSVDAVITSYYSHVSFTSLSPATQSMRRAILERFREDYGQAPIDRVRSDHLAKIIGRKKPYAQRNWRKTLRGLMRFCVLERHVKSDPTIDIELVRTGKTQGFKTWPSEHIEAYRKRHPLGTKARLAFEILICSGQRRADIVVMGKQHIRSGVLSIVQSKTGVLIEIPVLPEMRAAIDAMPSDHLTFLVTEYGKPFTAAGFTGWFRERCNEAGIPTGYSAHGLRKAAATMHADAGATSLQLMAWFGWSTLAEAERYTRAADRKRLAAGMAEKLAVKNDGPERKTDG